MHKRIGYAIPKRIARSEIMQRFLGDPLQMIRRLGIGLASLLAAGSGMAADCPGYDAPGGTKVELVGHASGKPAQGFFTERFAGEPVDINSFAGQTAMLRGRGPIEVTTEGCQTVFLHRYEPLTVVDEEALGVRFLQPLPSTWITSVQEDPITDARSCSVTSIIHGMPAPLFFFHSKQGFSVGAIGGDFPGRPVALRVDKHKAVTGTENLGAAASAALAKQVVAGGRVLTVAAYEWPHDYQQVKQFPLDGLATALDTCRREVRVSR